jgi:cytochrome P450/NADPH-cytochrome P450 reductase
MKIPHLSGPVPLRGLRHLDSSRPIQSFVKLSLRHGPVFTLSAPDRRLVVISDPSLMSELGDGKRFRKRVTRPLAQLREMAGDGLFTAESDDPAWERAHRILAPAFTGSALGGYHQAMGDVALQLVARWSRSNPGECFDAGQDFTRLTLETIGLCGFGYRFHCFRRHRPHPFVRAMTESLEESMRRCFRPPWESWFNLPRRWRHRQNLRTLFDTVETLIQQRRASGQRQPDLLDRMLWESDPLDGSKMSDAQVRYQILTLLIAGHETTTGLLAFALRCLLNHPASYARARLEVDECLGSEAEVPSATTLKQMPYLEAVLQETLRLWPTAPVYSLFAVSPTTLSNGLSVTPKDDLIILLPALQRNATAWPEPERFLPERFLEKANQPVQRCAHRPFGQGKRICIGRLFALQEARLTLAMLLRDLDLENTSQSNQERETLTMKPEAFLIRSCPRR